MTTENDVLPSSATPEHSRPWREIAKLGRRIVEELDLRSDNRVLGRWMAHRVAELMAKAEITEDASERRQVQIECEALIYRLWEQRANWPYGGPLEGILPTLQRMLGPNDKYYGWHHTPLNESGIVGKLIQLHTHELHLVEKLAALQVSPELADISEEWLHEYADDLSERESDVLKVMIRIVRRKPAASEDEVEMDDNDFPDEALGEQPVENEAIIRESLENEFSTPENRIIAALARLSEKRKKLYQSVTKK